MQRYQTEDEHRKAMRAKINKTIKRGYSRRLVALQDSRFFRGNEKGRIRKLPSFEKGEVLCSAYGRYKN